MNINEEIKVELTDHGWNVYREFYEKLGVSAPLPKRTAGYQVFQLWSFMNIFGDEMWNGNPNIVLKDNTIRF